MNGENLGNSNNAPDMDDALWDMPADINNMTYVEGQGYVDNDYLNAWKNKDGNAAAEAINAAKAEEEKELEAEPAPDDKKQLKMSWAMMMNYYKQHPEEISDLTEDSERAAKAAEGVKNEDRSELDKIVTEYIAAGRKRLGKVAVEAVMESQDMTEIKLEDLEPEAEPAPEVASETRKIEVEDKSDEILSNRDFTVDFSMDDDWSEQIADGKTAEEVAADWMEVVERFRREADQAFYDKEMSRQDYDRWSSYFDQKERELEQKVALENQKMKTAEVASEDDEDEFEMEEAKPERKSFLKRLGGRLLGRNTKGGIIKEIKSRLKPETFRAFKKRLAVTSMLVGLSGLALFGCVKPGRNRQVSANTVSQSRIEQAAPEVEAVSENEAEEVDLTVDLSQYKTEHGEVLDSGREFTVKLGDEQVSMNTISRNGVFNMLREDTYYQSGKHSEHSFSASMYEGEHKGAESDAESLKNFNRSFAQSHELLSIVDDNLGERRNEKGGLARVNEQADYYTDNDEAFNAGVERVSTELADFADGGSVETKTIQAGKKYGSLYEREIVDESKMVYSELSANEIEKAAMVADKNVEADRSVVKSEDRHGFMIYDSEGKALITKEKASEYFGVPASKIDSVWILEECNNIAILYKATPKPKAQPEVQQIAVQQVAQPLVQPQPVVVNGIPVYGTTTPPPSGGGGGGHTPVPTPVPTPDPTPTPTPTPEPTPTPTPEPTPDDSKNVDELIKNAGDRVVQEGVDELTERPDYSQTIEEQQPANPVEQESDDGSGRTVEQVIEEANHDEAGSDDNRTEEQREEDRHEEEQREEGERAQEEANEKAESEREEGDRNSNMSDAEAANYEL